MNAVVAREEEVIEPQNMLAVISRAASDPTVDVEKMERLMAMAERMQARKSEGAFNDAMNRAQTRIGTVGVDKTNSQTHSKYATYEKLNRILRPIYTSEGFSLSFGTAEPIAPETMRVLCHVSHSAGHTRRYQIDTPVDGKGAKGNDVMTKTHAVGSGASYAMRYLLKMIFNVAIGEEDDDGNGGQPTEHLSPEFADWRSKVDACASPEDFAAVWKEMSPQVRRVMAPYVKEKKEAIA
jgi:hypothetical protein